jgi:chemotaxis protein methyltransferase CheR
MTETKAPLWTGEDLSDEEFDAISDLLRDRRQLDLDQYKDRCVRRRIAKRLRITRAADFNAYLERLKSDRAEMETLLDTLSIHVSQFFRNPDTFRILERQVLPDLCRRARQAGRNTVTLWSAGCASGEEPYSLAMLADDLVPPGMEVHVLATDISESVLATARTGAFEGSRLREVPAKVIKKYFRRQGDSYQIVERIRDRVRFTRHNILADTGGPAADLILCRNVLIYFTRPEQERILYRFAEAMPENGALVLGRSETMVGELRGYFQAEFPVERIYRRTAQQVPVSMQQQTDGARPCDH